jgi:hypothetical protein
MDPFLSHYSWNLQLLFLLSLEEQADMCCNAGQDIKRIPTMNTPNASRIIASKLITELDQQGLPTSIEWNQASPVTFCHDWRGENADPQRETEARMLWSGTHLFIRFLCRYREIYAKEGSNRRRDELWTEDVAEIFIQRGTDETQRYREFEISPKGDWLDLEINARQRSFLLCDLIARTTCDTEKWIAELAIPMNALTPLFDPSEIWRLNLFRIEGREPKRFYSAWHPTHTPQPDFHVPEQFGELIFASS